MKKFALATATATALTLAMANAAFAQPSQAPMTLAAGEVTQAKEATSDTWITTKVKADLLTEKGIMVRTSKLKPTTAWLPCPPT